MSKFESLPYFDLILEQLRRGNVQVANALGNNVHWGFWENFKNADISPEGFLQASDRMNQEMFRQIDFTDGHQILDAGCGFGGTIAALNQRGRNNTLIGLNIDPRQIDRANEKVKPQAKNNNHIDFIVGDACALPFGNERFDYILAVECIFHFPSKPEFFREAFRVLKPGGKLIFSDFLSTPGALLQKIFLYLRHRSAVRKVYGKGAVPYTASKYRRLAKVTGFDVLNIRDINDNTLPTYEFIHKLSAEFGTDQEKMRQGNLFIEQAAKKRYSIYSIVELQKKADQ